jgi:hypothetical protein
MSRAIGPAFIAGDPVMVRFSCGHCGWHLSLTEVPESAAKSIKPDHYCSYPARYVGTPEVM